ncbi:hypothetical protein QBC38DRAFT_517842 [Podospora fimiseda]|uniref:Zn(2)-C6 fungal-type domain-containing protein n=1 Tax=Podospora fimiseda TaxID=252190 RepID=A0AAN7BG76_9PEZI|nr:hypothetical protein QBC38DRAFT_517842 [Podospora fimiseda]
MPRPTTKPTTDVTRIRKKHTKSRGGCQNCKLRRVKCDEAKPSCNTCQSFRVICSYNKLSTTTTTMQAFAEGMFLVDLTVTNPPSLSLNRQFLTMLNDHHAKQSDTTHFFQTSDLEILNRFHERTVLSIQADQPTNVYQREFVRLALQTPFLFHLVLTTTLLHDRQASSPLKITPQPSPEELFHLATGSSQFNQLLSLPSSHITSPQKDAIYFGAILLACTSFAQIDSQLPITSHFPFTSGEHDLSWLRFCCGKKAIHKLVDVPSRPDSALRTIAGDFTLPMGQSPVAGVDFHSDRKAMSNLPETLIKLLGLDFEGVTPSTNVYYTVTIFLGKMLALDLTFPGNVLVCLILISNFPVRFIELLEIKDPRALILLGYFYGKIVQSKRWWMMERPRVEGRAIVEYLRGYYGGDILGLEGLLEFPRRWCCEE